MLSTRDYDYPRHPRIGGNSAHRGRCGGAIHIDKLGPVSRLGIVSASIQIGQGCPERGIPEHGTICPGSPVEDRVVGGWVTPIKGTCVN